jgi:hypothetical protein
MAIDPDFYSVTKNFTFRVKRAADWRNTYFGAAYSTRVKAAIKELKEAIEDAEKCVELKPD